MSKDDHYTVYRLAVSMHRLAVSIYRPAVSIYRLTVSLYRPAISIYRLAVYIRIYCIYRVSGNIGDRLILRFAQYQAAISY